MHGDIPIRVDEGIDPYGFHREFSKAGTTGEHHGMGQIGCIRTGAPDHTLSAMPRRRYRAGAQRPSDYCPADARIVSGDPPPTQR